MFFGSTFRISSGAIVSCLALTVLHCTTKTEETAPAVKNDPLPSPEDASANPSGDAATDASSATCETAKCETGDDCPGALGGTGGCWKCAQNCCVPHDEGSDPTDACQAKSTACTTSKCDGKGACSTPTEQANGTPCGAVCHQGSGTWFLGVGATCQQGRCEYTYNDNVDPCPTAAPTCTGTQESCGACPPSGCKAQCTAGSASQTCP